MEVMPVTPALKEKIACRASIADIIAEARNGGMRTLYEHGISKVIEGITTMEEVMNACTE